MPPGFRAILRAAKEAGPIPVYATEEWADLRPDDPRRIAAVIIAAECWVQFKAETPQRLADDLVAENQRSMRRWQDACQDVRGVERMDNSPRRTGATQEALQAARRA